MTTRDKALRHFRRVDSRFYEATKAHHTVLPEELGGRTNLFESLCKTVVSQQLGTRAASTIFARVKKVCGGKLSPRSVMEVRAVALRAAGLSAAKQKTLKELAKAVEGRKISLQALRALPYVEVESRLTEIWGLGPWSAEMFSMFSLGHPDIFSASDLGLARGIEQVYKLPQGTPRAKLVQIADKWAPYRTFASLLLWRIKDTKLG